MKNIKSIEYLTDHGRQELRVGEGTVTAIRLTEERDNGFHLEYDHAEGGQPRTGSMSYAGFEFFYVNEQGLKVMTEGWLAYTLGNDRRFLHMGGTYSPDCPACLGARLHSMNEHWEKLARNEECSGAAYPARDE